MQVTVTKKYASLMKMNFFFRVMAMIMRVILHLTRPRISHEEIPVLFKGFLKINEWKFYFLFIARSL